MQKCSWGIFPSWAHVIVPWAAKTFCRNLQIVFDAHRVKQMQRFLTLPTNEQQRSPENVPEWMSSEPRTSFEYPVCNDHSLK